jgi:tetratricopeptide (TPR) repeat protein
MAGYVICAECGARIKADREHCLRCGEPLRGVEPPAPPLPLHEALDISQGALQILVLVGALTVVGVGVMLWQLRPETVRDEIAQPFGPALERNAVPPPPEPPDPGTPVEAAPSPSLEPATSFDATRSGSAKFSAGDYEAAKNDFEQAVEKNANDPEAHNNLGQALVHLGRVAEAIPHLERAVTLAPDKWAYRFNLGHAVGEIGQWARAVSEYREALKIFPNDYATQYNLALALYKKGDVSAAIPEFEKAIAFAPAEPSFHFSLAMALEKAGRVEDAIREYRRFLEMEPFGADAAKVKAHIDLLTPTQPQGRGSNPPQR